MFSKTEQDEIIRKVSKPEKYPINEIEGLVYTLNKLHILDGFNLKKFCENTKTKLGNPASLTPLTIAIDVIKYCHFITTQADTMQEVTALKFNVTNFAATKFKFNITSFAATMASMLDNHNQSPPPEAIALWAAGISWHKFEHSDFNQQLQTPLITSLVAQSLVDQQQLPSTIMITAAITALKAHRERVSVTAVSQLDRKQLVNHLTMLEEFVPAPEQPDLPLHRIWLSLAALTRFEISLEIAALSLESLNFPNSKNVQSDFMTSLVDHLDSPKPS